MKYDKIIIGAGIYGLYAALYCARREEKIVVLEYDEAPFMRATYCNQARVHMGYHYPRSFSTAIKSTHYFNRFNDDFGICIHKKFDQIYAISENFSWTNAEQYKKFCDSLDIKCEEVSVSRYFNPKTCDGAFLTEEYTYDADILKQYFLSELEKYKNVTIFYNVRIIDVKRNNDNYYIKTKEHEEFLSIFVLNATYASINQIINLFGFAPFSIKHELCEMIIVNVNDNFKKVGLTVMDGPFFSIMPFGKTEYHSLYSVNFSPHKTSYDTLPVFKCQESSDKYCSQNQLGNCNNCNAKPNSAWNYMSSLARKYVKSSLEFNYSHSLFSMKPILNMSEIDDSRPTVIKKHSENPYFISVLSGKINTIYDIDEVL
jgi:hypothetical protein